MVCLPLFLARPIFFSFRLLADRYRIIAPLNRHDERGERRGAVFILYQFISPAFVLMIWIASICIYSLPRCGII